MIKSLIILLIVFSSLIFSQSEIQKQYEIAEELYSSEKYYDAVTEYKRLLFFDNDSVYTFSANYKIGKGYKEGGKFTDAIEYLTRAEINSSSVEKIFSAKEEIIKINILRRTNSRAHQLLDSLQSDKRFRDYQNKLIYWRGWNYIFADQWDLAVNEFSKIDSLKELTEFCKEVDDELYSVTTAKVLSYIIPGAGQFYTGEYLSGLMSLGWNVLWGYVTINAIIEERVLDGILVANFLWLRFYNGNIQNAEKFAEEKNLLITNEALNYLQYQYDGEKP